jgi:thiol-disulfide isomerase/thioredoxin
MVTYLNPMRTIALLLACTAAAFAASVPRPAPELIMQRGNAPAIRLSQFRGKIVALALMQTTCSHCQLLTTTLKQIQKDYAARNVQVVECAFEEGVNINYPMFLKALEPNFPTGYTTNEAVHKFLQWTDLVDGMLYVPYMIFIDAGGTIRGDFSGKDGFFAKADERVRAELDKMTHRTASPATKKK